MSLSPAVAHIPQLSQFVEGCCCVPCDTQRWKYLWTWWIKLNLNAVIKDLPFTFGKRSCTDKVTLFQNDNWKHLKLFSSSSRNKAQKSAAIPVLKNIAEHKGLTEKCHKTSSELQLHFCIFLSHWSSVATRRYCSIKGLRNSKSYLVYYFVKGLNENEPAIFDNVPKPGSFML